MTLHDKQKYKPTERFTGLAEKYAQGRPSYPQEAIDYIIAHCHLSPGSTVIDVGSGTGISSRLFAERGMQVLGIEPNEDMRLKASEETFSAQYPQPKYLPGTAEATNIEDHYADLVVCAQAFHWFNPNRALKEFNRILKPDAWLTLLWNERDDIDPFTHAYSKLLQSLPDTKNLEMKRGKAGTVLLNYPLFGQATKKQFAYIQTVDLEGLLNRAFSTSYAPKDKELVQDFEHKLRGLFNQFQTDEQVSFTYVTSIYLGQRRPD